jgi:ABC-type uncharacterized transport system involved in gliding motility auxiliary subunit
VALMRTRLNRFAPLGLYLSLLALLVSLGLYVVQREWNLYIQISLGLFIIGLAVFAILDPDRVRVALTGRQARYGSNALVMSIASIGIVLVVNYLAYKNPQRWDLTEGQQHTLANETLATLKTLPQPVQVTAFYPQNVSRTAAQSILDEYKIASNGKFTYKFVDPNADPVAAKAANVTLSPNGTIVLKMGDRQDMVSTTSESDITSALVRMMAQKQTIYFLTGHGEYSPEDTGDQSYATAKTTLEAKSYTVKLLNLLADNKIPSDAHVIVIAGPTKPLSDNEVKLLSDFQDKGGSLVVMEEPTLRTDFGDSPDPLAKYLSDKWGIVLGNDIIIDTTSSQPYSPFAASYSSHPITDKLQRLGTAFPTARSVSTGKAIDGVTDTELIKTADQSWAETDLQGLKNNQQPQPDPSKDFMGPVPLAVAGERTGSQAKVVVIGDSDFAIDANFSYLGNGDLLINSIDWASGQANLINLTPKSQVTRTMVLPTTYTMGLIALGTIFVLPGMVLVSGIVVFIQRRKRG